MRTPSISIAILLAGAVAACPAAGRPAPGTAAPVKARVVAPPPGTQRPTRDVFLSIGQGELITLPTSVTDVWISNPGVADVYVRNPRQINLFGKEFGESTVFATGAGGAVVYSANIRVSQNISSVERMIHAAMPDADIKVTTVGQIALLTGTVATPADAAQAKELATMILNPGVDLSSGAALKVGVISRLKTATPLQVNLSVRIAEVSRSFAKNLGVNLQSFDGTGGFKFGIGQGRSATQYYPLSGLPTRTGTFIGGGKPDLGNTGLSGVEAGSTLAGAGKLLGFNLLGSLDLGETMGQVTTLANPNLTSLSGETATFLAGGEIPIPISQGLGAVSVEYKQYGISLAYTPTVLSDGRISMRVRPEVSQLSSAGAVTIGGTTIPALTTRRAETTVELGSGQSLVIGGLMSNTHQNSLTKAPGIGDLPILGALFRSNGFQRNETELVIVITPYLVKPVDSPSQIALPTDGYRSPADYERVLVGSLGYGQSGAQRPVPTMAPTGKAPAGPAAGAATPASSVTPTANPTTRTGPAPKSGWSH